MELHLPYYECKSETSNEFGLLRIIVCFAQIEFTERITKMEPSLTIGTLAYNESNGVLVVVYQNGNVDLIKGNKVYNLPDIKRSQIVADKSINEVYFIGSLAYLSTGFGIIVVDTDRNEIKDTYLIGQNGIYIGVYDITSDGTVLYAATANGVYQLSNPFPVNNRGQCIPSSGGLYSSVDVSQEALL